MPTQDPELARLFLQELQKHLPALEAQHPERDAAQRAVHALKGGAGLVGERELAASLERLHRRMKEGDAAAVREAATLVRVAAQRLAAGQSATPAQWPVPPEDLVALPLDPLVRSQYGAEMMDRLAQIDDALASGGDPLEAAHAIYRHVHTMKGAASAVGDEPMSWFCHGLEERLKGADSTGAALAATQEAARWRVVLGALLDDANAALASLRARGRSSQAPRPPSRPALAAVRASESEPPRSQSSDDAPTIRVPASDVDRLLERFDAIDRVRETLAARAAAARDTARELRALRTSLVEALRLIGPPRPWGAPAAALQLVERAAATLGAFGDDLDAGSSRLGASEHVLREGVHEAKKELSAMRQTTVGRIFGRLTTAVESEARRRDRTVIVRTRGADETVDRRLAEQLVEPCLQLVRNAVAHGIEAPEARTAAGKPPSGTVTLAARKLGNRLRITIDDDGAGVDVADVRARAVDAGLVTQAIAQAADDHTLLSLLFEPGFSTRPSTDLLAGRGIGLDITRTVIQRLGGVIRLSSRAGQGFGARIDVPIDSGLVSVLWVTAGDLEVALPAANALRVRPNDAPVPHLLACLDLGAREAPAAFVVDLKLEEEDGDDSPVAVGVDAVGGTEELLVRPIGPLLVGLGPFAGAIARGDGSLRLAIDAWGIAPRARALSAAQPR